MPNQQENLNLVFSALADPTRRSVLLKLCENEATVSELAEPFNMALPSFTQHLGVLEDCGLIKTKKKGRSRVVRLVPKKLRIAETWLDKQRKIWERRFDQMDEYLLKLKEEKNES